MYDESKYRSYPNNPSNPKKVLGFGVRDRIGDLVASTIASKDFIFKKLYQPEYQETDPNDPKRVNYNYHNWDKIKTEVYKFFFCIYSFLLISV